VSELRAQIPLPSGALAVRTARLAARAVLHGWHLNNDEWLDEAELVVTELVANAVRHAGGCQALELVAHNGIVTVTAVDTSATPPVRRRPDQNGGRGLEIVDALSTEWGVNTHDGGKRVLAQLDPYLDSSKI
jgi:anti-sigma regulatory factor (Ser/Thr protein kinase)